MKFRILLSLVFAVSALVRSAASDGAIQAERLSVSKNSDGSATLFFYENSRTDTAFASMTFPADTGFTILPGAVRFESANSLITVHSGCKVSDEKSFPFFLIEAHPLFQKSAPVIESLSLPPIRLNSDSDPKSFRTFGSGGLAAIEEGKGSYAFLGLLNPNSNSGILAGWLTCRRGSGVFFSSLEKDQAAIVPRIDYGRYLLSNSDTVRDNSGEIMVLGSFDDLRDGLEAYGNALAWKNDVHLKPAPTGYCTWYSNKNGGCGSEESTAEFAKKAAEKLVPYGMNFFQIDDGWQLGNSHNGPNKNFTSHNPNGPYHSGMKKTADLLESLGMTTGIWFMPFSGNADDPWYADKQNFFIRSAIDYPAPGEKNTRIYSHINQVKGAPYETYWGGTCLDMSRPEVQDYLYKEVYRIAHEWNCRYFKIDGLWTGSGTEQLYVNDEYLPDDLGKQIFSDPAITNIEAYRKGLSIVRKAAGDNVFILGCNVSQNMRVMGASIGFVDAMRIGPDNGSDWQGICKGPWRATNRYFYNGRVWWNDPDPVYVRDSIPLSHAQTITSWAALSGQLYAFSDWLPDLSEERINVIRRTIPNHQLTTVRPVDLFSSDLARIWILTAPACKTTPNRYVAGIFNWNENEEAAFRLSAESLGIPTVKEYAVFDFWGDRLLSCPENTPLSATVPAASCLIAAIRPVTDARPLLLSTSRHVTQGILEVTGEKWNARTNTLTISLNAEKAALTEELPYQLRVWKSGQPENVSVTAVSGGRLLANGTVQIKTEEESGKTLYRITLPRLTPEEITENNVDIIICF